MDRGEVPLNNTAFAANCGPHSNFMMLCATPIASSIICRCCSNPGNRMSINKRGALISLTSRLSSIPGL
ncbi:hypothetical protein D3C84_1183130 [compost metagenome]